MPPHDSRRQDQHVTQETPSFGQPATLRFWLISSGLIALIAIGGLLLPPPSAKGPDESGGIVVTLQDPAGHSPKDPHTAPGAGHTAAHPEHAPPPNQVSDLGRTLVAANGAIVLEPALLERSPDGPLPIVAQDGRKPMTVYAAKYDAADKRPRVAIILTGLGLSDSVTQLAIDKMPPGTALAMSPYGQNQQNWTAAARAKGHEVLLELPMEPFDYPNDDPGPQTLLTGAAGQDNPQRLNSVLARFGGYAGVVNAQGAKFLASPNDLRPIASQLSRRGLILADVSVSQRSLARQVAKETATPFAAAQIQIDKSLSGEGVDAALDELANLALQQKIAVGVAAAAPNTIERISAWSAALENKGVVFMPLTATIAQPGASQ
jgi:uncharacterized protein